MMSHFGTDIGGLGGTVAAMLLRSIQDPIFAFAVNQAQIF